MKSKRIKLMIKPSFDTSVYALSSFAGLLRMSGGFELRKIWKFFIDKNSFDLIFLFLFSLSSLILSSPLGRIEGRKIILFFLMIFSLNIYSHQGNPAILERNREIDDRLRNLQKSALISADLPQKRVFERRGAIFVNPQAQAKRVRFEEPAGTPETQLEECKGRYNLLIKDYNTLVEHFKKTVETNRAYEQKLTFYEDTLAKSKETLDLCMGKIDRLMRCGMNQSLAEDVQPKEGAIYKRALQILFTVDDMVIHEEIDEAQLTEAFNSMRAALLGLIKTDEIFKDDIIRFKSDWIHKIAQNLQDAAERVERGRIESPSSSVRPDPTTPPTQPRSESPKPMQVDVSEVEKQQASTSYASPRKRKIQEKKMRRQAAQSRGK